MQNLRSKLIRLAYQDPELRAHVLPLLAPNKTAAMDTLSAYANQWVSEALQAVSKKLGGNLRNTPMGATLSVIPKNMAPSYDVEVTLDLIGGKMTVAVMSAVKSGTTVVPLKALVSASTNSGAAMILSAIEKHLK